MGTLYEDVGILVTIPRSILLRIINVSHKSYIENHNTYFPCTDVFYVNRDIYEIRWKIFAELDRPQTTIQHGACALHAG
jgi:hypothetical protein